MTNRKPIPYNTGKVLIGSRYERPNVVPVTHEDALWQDVLLGEYHEKRRHRVKLVVAVVGVVLAYLMLAAFAGVQR